MRKRKWIYGLICVCLAVFLTSCGKDKGSGTESETGTQAAPTETAGEDETEEPTESAEKHEGEARSLLTGKWIDEELLLVRPVAVMVENTSMSLPQYGLAKADVVYECPVEGGITRLMPIYQDYSGMDKIGNIRSCRLYYVYFAKEFDALYFHSGQSKYALDVLNSSFIDNVNGITGKGGAFYYQDKSRKMPHNTYTSSELIAAGIERHGYADKLDETAASHYRFATEEAPNLLAQGEDAVVVALYYANPKPWFEYNAEDGRYYRFQFKAAQVDALTGEQLAADNIIIQNCKSSLKDKSNGTLDIDHRSGGTGIFITRGKAIDITWTRESDSARTRYFDASGAEIELNPGVTWVEITENSYAAKNVIYKTREEYK
ncbi:MAG: DUF3048 domain-containing protein [Agathobacter sp.]|nr:DUF3048 domain-containing protein [Agathobacter sp.]